jgi:TIR domain/YARHG domain
MSLVAHVASDRRYHIWRQQRYGLKWIDAPVAIAILFAIREPCEAAVADIFISYATVDRALAAQLAAFLHEHGYSVWWDRELSAGEQFYAKLAQSLADCRAAIVIWTGPSVESRWVLGEADTAASANKLIPVREDSLPERELPIGFRALHTIPLSDQQGLLRAIKVHFEAAPKALSRSDVFKLRLLRRFQRARQWMSPGKAAIVALIAGLSAYFFLALTDWFTIRDSMEPSDFQHHLATFPFSPFAPLARNKLTGVDEYEIVMRSRSIDEWRQYTEKYPGSLYHPFALLRSSRLQALASQKYSPVLLPDSSRRLLTPEEISSLNCTQLWTARNEIYYAVGYCFFSDAAINAFRTQADCPHNNCNMIKKFNSLAQDVISNTENENISRLSRREDEQGCRKPPVVGTCIPKP